MRAVAPQVRLLVANVTSGSCQPVHGIAPATAAPLGSAFKLYVLDTLGNAIESGKASWDQSLTITARLKSLPSGELQTEPDGTRISVRDTAAKMISISDNTAANMLIYLVGRPAVEAALTTTGMADPARDRPFLTRELFILKLDQWPTLAEHYVAADRGGGRALLATVIDRAPASHRLGGGSVDRTTRHQQPRMVRLGRRHLPRLRIPRRPRPPPGLSPIGEPAVSSTMAGSNSTGPGGRRSGLRADPSRGS